MYEKQMMVNEMAMPDAAPAAATAEAMFEGGGGAAPRLRSKFPETWVFETKNVTRLESLFSGTFGLFLQFLISWEFLAAPVLSNSPA